MRRLRSIGNYPSVPSSTLTWIVGVGWGRVCGGGGVWAIYSVDHVIHFTSTSHTKREIFRKLSFIHAESRTNRKLSRWRHLTTTTRIQFDFLFLFKFCISRGVKITIALISMRQAKLEGFWYLQSNGVIMQVYYWYHVKFAMALTLKPEGEVDSEICVFYHNCL